jgi:preprotein translocase subunit SecG
LIATLVFLAAGAATPVPAGPVSVPTLPPQSVPSWGSGHPFIMYLVQVLFVLSVIALIALMSVQTTKTEGLSGTIGGRAESAYRGRLGFDQQLARLTGFIAVSFMVLAIIDFLITR